LFAFVPVPLFTFAFSTTLAVCVIHSLCAHNTAFNLALSGFFSLGEMSADQKAITVVFCNLMAVLEIF